MVLLRHSGGKNVVLLRSLIPLLTLKLLHIFQRNFTSLLAISLLSSPLWRALPRPLFVLLCPLLVLPVTLLILPVLRFLLVLGALLASLSLLFILFALR